MGRPREAQGTSTHPSLLSTPRRLNHRRVQDYSLRAKDYNAKKARLKALRHKAAERNPDEFHFAMMSSSTHDGGRRVADRGNKALSTEVVKLLKTQDAAYLRTVAQTTRRARERRE